MTRKEAEQIITLFQSKFINESMLPDLIRNSHLDVEYAVLRDDWFKGDNKQEYKTKSVINYEHAFLNRGKLIQMSRELSDAIYKICVSNNWTNQLNRFNFVLKNLPENFVHRIKNDRAWC